MNNKNTPFFNLIIYLPLISFSLNYPAQAKGFENFSSKSKDESSGEYSTLKEKKGALSPGRTSYNPNCPEALNRLAIGFLATQAVGLSTVTFMAHELHKGAPKPKSKNKPEAEKNKSGPSDGSQPSTQNPEFNKGKLPAERPLTPENPDQP